MGVSNQPQVPGRRRCLPLECQLRIIQMGVLCANTSQGCPQQVPGSFGCCATQIQHGTPEMTMGHQKEGMLILPTKFSLECSLLPQEEELQEGPLAAA